MRANLTFNLQDTDTDKMLAAVSAALKGDLGPAKEIGKVKVLPDYCPCEDEDD